MESIFSGLLRALIVLRALKNPLKIDSLTAPYHRVPAEMSDMEMFLEFKKFKQMMKATAPAPPPPSPPPTFASVAAYPAVFQFKKLPGAAQSFFPMKKDSDSASTGSSEETKRRTGFNYDYFRQKLFGEMRPTLGDGKSEHANLFWMYKHLYEEHPERFTHVSDIHSAEDGRMYFSINYSANSEKNGAMLTNFHIYGEMKNINGRQKFMFRSVDILAGRQMYENAAVFYI